MVEEETTDESAESSAPSKATKFGVTLLYASLSFILLLMFIPIVEKVGLGRFLLGILILDVAVLVHEFGHLIAGLRAKIPVNVFSIGIGPPVLKRTMRGIEWRLSLFPLGGYVRTRDHDELDTFTPGQMARYAWGGPFASFVLAFVALFVSGLIGQPYGIAEPLTVKELRGTNATKAGVMRGDVVERIDTMDLTTDAAKKAPLIPDLLKGKSKASVVINRKGERHELTVPLSKIDGRSAVGIVWAQGNRVMNVGDSAKEAGKWIFDFAATPVMVPYMFLTKPKETAAGVGGPGGIVQMATEGTDGGPGRLLYVLGILSGILGGFNLVPIVPLDGGHLVNSFIRFLLRKRPKVTIDKVLAAYVTFSFVCFLALFTIAIGNDISK